MSLFKYILAGVIVTIPAVVLEQNNTSIAWYYVFLLVLALVVFYNRQFMQLSAVIQ